MASEITDKDYVIIKIPKRTGTDGIKKVRDYIQFLDVNGGVPKKVSQKTIHELSRKINKEARIKLKNKRKIIL